VFGGFDWRVREEVGEFRKALSGIEFGDSLREKGEQREPYPNSTLYAFFFFF